MSVLNWFSPRKRRRVVVLGVDGMDAALTQRWMSAGDLPALARLAEQGAFAPLRTTNPAESPVAWASFATGLNPGKHGIFDFVQRNAGTYAPEVGPLRVRMSVDGRGLEAVNNRHGRTFWDAASEASKRCVLLRVPGTCPPERVRGKMLSGLGVPDLLGSWGTSWLFATAEDKAGEGARRLLPGPDGNLSGDIPGPLETKIAFSAQVRDGALGLSCAGKKMGLHEGEWSDWLSLSFTTPLGVEWRAITRFYLERLQPEIRLYLSPLNLDPRRPALPLTYPGSYADELVQRYGLFSTLGWPEDVSGLNAGRLDERGFLHQVDETFEAHATLTLDALGEGDWDLLVSVFEALDRVQHMFWRDQEAGEGEYARVIGAAYRRLDDFVARLVEALGPDDTLFILSDHGFGAVRKLVHVNAWLRDHGYLAIRAGGNERSGTLWSDVDWGRTQAYALGLSKIYINLAGREGQGSVSPGRDYEAAIREISEALLDLRDPDDGQPVLRNVYQGRRVYSGPYYPEGGDLILGFRGGYRTSQRTALGQLAASVVVPNRARWSADHCSIDPPLVPGVLFTSQPLGLDDPSILDLAPTILDLLGVPLPTGLDGRSCAGR